MADGVQDEAEMNEENVEKPGIPEAGVEEGDIYEVEKIVGVCLNKGKPVYKVRWQGYTAQWDTWEPYENLKSCKDMIDAFMEEERKLQQMKGSPSKEDGEISFGEAASELSDSSKKGDARKKRKAAGYYYVSDGSEEADTLKDKFWRDLEHGKINVFDSGDMYSKVKGAGVRQSRPQSFTEMYQSPRTAEPDAKPITKGKQRKKSDSQKPKKVSRKGGSVDNDGAKRKGSRKRKAAELSKQDSVNSLASASSDIGMTIKTEDSNSSDVSYAHNKVLDFRDVDVKPNVDDLLQAQGEEYDNPSSVPVSQQSGTSDDPPSKDSFSHAAGSACPVLTSMFANSQPESQMDTSDHSSILGSQSQTSGTIALPRGGGGNLSVPSATFPASVSVSKDSSHPPGPSDTDNQPPSVGNTTAPLSVGESELSGDSGNVDIDSLPRSNNSLLNTYGEMADEEFEFDLDDIDGMEWDGKIVENTTMILISTNAELRQAVKVNDYQRVTQAFRTGRPFDIEQGDHGGLSLALIAAQNGFDDLLELLVMRGASIHAEQKGTGVTALMLAAEQGLLCTVALLLEMGAHINCQTPNGETALIKAIKRSHVEVVKLMLDHGANFASTNGGEHTSMRCAKLTNHAEIIDLLSHHISKVTAEFENQVKVTLNNTATIMTALFPIQCFSLREADKIRISFKHELTPTSTGRGMLLFIAHARISNKEARCRFYGPCAVSGVTLNNVPLKPVTEESNFVLSFSPLHNGRNDVEITTLQVPTSRAKLVVCAYQAQLQ